MHEWSIAEGIISAVLEEADGRRVKEVEIRVGELRDLDLEALEMAASSLAKGTPAEGARFRFIESRASFRCLRCGESWRMEKALEMVREMLAEEGYVLEEDELEPPIHFIPTLIMGLQRCPKCGGMDIEIEAGHEVELVKIVLEVD